MGIDFANMVQYPLPACPPINQLRSCEAEREYFIFTTTYYSPFLSINFQLYYESKENI